MGDNNYPNVVNNKKCDNRKYKRQKNKNFKNKRYSRGNKHKGWKNKKNYNKNNFNILEQDLDNLKVIGLKELCKKRNINTNKCRYREDYIKLLLNK